MNEIKHLYIHVPYCNSICYYCDFCHFVYNDKDASRWLERLKKEISDNCKDQYETIYIGGGSPSCLKYEYLKQLFQYLKPYTDCIKEYTVEVNPESLDVDKIKLFKEFGINRISMGVQSSDDDILKSLNRKHSFADAKEKIILLKDNGIDNISVDLMYSLPFQTIDILNKTIDDILALNIPHISIYSLTIEENTVFGKTKIQSLNQDDEADMYELIEKRLIENNYIHYEVSNYCLEGFESKHNMSYWNYEDFLGLSLGASGKIANNRYTNTRNFNKYLSNEIKDEDLILEKKEMMFENIMMSLRTIYGLDIERFNKTYDCNLLEEYPFIKDDPNLEIVDNHLICNRLEILNTVLLNFL